MVKVTRRKNSAGVGVCTLASAGFFYLKSLSYLNRNRVIATCVVKINYTWYLTAELLFH